MECSLWRLLILSRSVSKHGHHMQFLFLIGRFLKNLLLWNCLAIWTETWKEASTCIEGSVLSFLKAEWKVNDIGSAHWASSFQLFNWFQLFSFWEKLPKVAGHSQNMLKIDHRAIFHWFSVVLFSYQNHPCLIDYDVFFSAIVDELFTS